jgi:hypothetical protein
VQAVFPSLPEFDLIRDESLPMALATVSSEKTFVLTFFAFLMFVGIKNVQFQN